MNQTTKEVSAGIVRVYACGGCGENIAAQIQKIAPQHSEVGFGKIEIVYCDTSLANLNSLRGLVSSEQIYHIKHLDGAGGNRKSVGQDVQSHVPDILLKHAPGDINIVIHSASGGSGSVIGPVIMRELLNDGIPAVALVVGSSVSLNETQNTINTIKTFAGISNATDKPYVVSYVENSATISRELVDKHVVFSILSISMLFSRQNTGLDSADLRNWLNYTEVSRCGPELVNLSILHNEENTAVDGYAVSAVSLYRDQIVDDLPFMPEFYKAGIVPADASFGTGFVFPQHFVIVMGSMAAVVDRLEEKLKKADTDSKVARNRGQIKVTNHDNGLVL